MLMEVTHAELMAISALQKALRLISLTCTEGYYGPDNHRYDVEAKRIAREALEITSPILSPWLYPEAKG